MTHVQIKRFLKKVAGHDIRVRYYWSKRHKWRWYTAFAFPDDNTVWLNKNRVFKIDDIYLKVLLMHELGHFKSNPESNAQSER